MEEQQCNACADSKGLSFASCGLCWVYQLFNLLGGWD